METGKPGLASAPVHISPVAAQTEKRMNVQAPLTALYIHAVPAPAAAREPAALHLAMPPLYSKETLPFLTLHIAGGLQSQPGLSLAAAAAPAARPKSAGKHVCPHCGRDCMKPSVLEKHLRCHTGERPYPCTTCGVSFKTQSNLYKHKRTQAHARLSSESEQSSLSSIDSVSSSRDTCTSSLSLDGRSEESGSMEKDAPEISCPASNAMVHSVKTQGSVGGNAVTPVGQKTEAKESAKVTIEGEKTRMENEKALPTASRHLPLQRQEATLFSKQWESCVSRGKSQSHESTDSGFSESSEHYPSPGSTLPDHSMDSLTESAKEHLEETTSTQTPSGPGQGGPKYTAREQEQKTLEERISKLISENTAVVEDKQLENVRPRKTVLSKQGSIDLPMPYTYKDSFHFDMRIGKTNVGLQRNRKLDFYSSVPTHRSNTMEHAPLTRSNSLPFSVTLMQPERSSPTSSYQRDYVTLVRRGSSGQINPAGFTIKPVNQHSSTHRPLVRQTAVDGNHATDGLFANSSVEEACTSSLSCDGDGGDICGEPSNRKFRRKKAQKFAYNKWYMYGGGTFKKLYNAEKGSDDGVIKSRKCPINPEQEVIQGLQKRSSAIHKETVTTMNFTSSSPTVCHPISLVSAADLKTSQLHTSCSSLKTPLQRNLSLSILPLSSIGSLVSHQTDSMSRAEAGRIIDGEKHTDSTLQLCGAQIPSDRKKLKTEEKIIGPLEMETDPNTETHPLSSVTCSAPQQDTKLTYINLQSNQKQLKAALFPTCVINANTPHVSTSPASSTPSIAKASFLPKYQLKIPNAAEPDSNRSPQDTFTSALSSSHTEQTSPSLQTSEKDNPITSAPIQTRDIKKTFSSTPHSLPVTVTTTLTLNPNASRSLAVVRRQSAATTITTTCLQNDQAGLCSTSIQPSKSAVPLKLPRPVAPVVVTAANNQSSAAAITAFSQPNATPPLSHTQLSPASDQPSPVHSSNSPVVPCHVVPFDQMQPDARNVFHVHTADLQICLQIISDEQLALIEPQIERQAGNGLSQRREAEAVIQNKVQRSVTMDQSEKSGRSQTTEEEHTISLHRCAEEQLLQDRRVCPGGLISQTLSGQHELSVISLSPSTVNEDSTSERPGEESQHKLKNQAASCSEGTNKAMGEASVYVCSRLESGEIPLPLQASVAATCADQPSGSISSFSINKCNASRQLTPQSSIYCTNPVESTSSSSSSEDANMGCDGMGPSREMTQSESQDVISSTQSEKQRAQYIAVSSNIQVERPKDTPAVLTGLMEGASLVGCAAQTQEHGETPGQPDGTHWRPKQSQETGKTNIQCMERRGGGEEKNGGIKTDEVPGQSNCTYMCLPDMTKPEGEDRKTKVDSFQNSFRPSEQHLQTHSAMCENPPQSKSNNLPSSDSIFNSLQPPLDTSNFYLSRHPWESSIIHNHHTQILWESDSSQCIKAQPQLTETHIPSGLHQKQTFSHQDQKQSSVPAVQQGHNSTESNNNTVLPSEPFTYPQPCPGDQAPSDCTSHSSNSGRADVTNKSFVLCGQFDDCLPSAARPVQSCQDYTEDTSSSDDEGKLIIEL